MCRSDDGADVEPACFIRERSGGADHGSRSQLWLGLWACHLASRPRYVGLALSAPQGTRWV